MTNSENINKDLIKNFPELKEDFEEFTEWQDGWSSGAILVLESVFVPFIKLSFDKNNQQNIIRIINYLEKVFDTQDEYQLNTFMLGVVEPIYESDLYKQIREKLLPNASRAFQKIENFKN